MKTASCKNKGRKLQQWVCAALVDVVGVACEDCKSCSMGAGGEDVVLSKAGRELFPYSVECKNRERHNVWDSYVQCAKNAPEGAEPLLVIKRNKSKPLVVVDARHFIMLQSTRGKYIAPTIDKTE